MLEASRKVVLTRSSMRKVCVSTRTGAAAPWGSKEIGANESSSAPLSSGIAGGLFGYRGPMAVRVKPDAPALLLVAWRVMMVTEVELTLSM